MKVELLKKEMDKAGMNITELSDASGVDKSTISRLLQGRVCSIETANKVANALNLSSDKAGQIFFSNKVA